MILKIHPTLSFSNRNNGFCQRKKSRFFAQRGREMPSYRLFHRPSNPVPTVVPRPAVPRLTSRVSCPAVSRPASRSPASRSLVSRSPASLPSKHRILFKPGFPTLAPFTVMADNDPPSPPREDYSPSSIITFESPPTAPLLPPP